MPVVAVVNRKGGSGKSTLATHLAGYLAGRGLPVMLGDVDRQQSTVPWLRRRTGQATTGAPIVGWVVDPKNTLRPPAGVAHVVLDTPAGLQGLELHRMLLYADAVLLPVADSAFDREAAAACIAELRAHPRVASGRVRLAVVGMRVDARTRGEQALRRWADSLGLPLVTTLRSTQSYVRCADQGLTLFDLPDTKVAIDRAQWQPLLEWLAPVLEAPAPTPALRAPRLTASTRPAAVVRRDEAVPVPVPGLVRADGAAPVRTVPPRLTPTGLGISLPAARGDRRGALWRRWLAWLVPSDRGLPLARGR